MLLKAGTVVDATLIAAPTSTKNKDKSRDPEMHSSKKGNQWYFGMKAHIGADAESGLVLVRLGAGVCGEAGVQFKAVKGGEGSKTAARFFVRDVGSAAGAVTRLLQKW